MRQVAECMLDCFDEGADFLPDKLSLLVDLPTHSKLLLRLRLELEVLVGSIGRE